MGTKQLLNCPNTFFAVSAIILAGGQAIRMQNKDKGLVHFKEQPLIEHVLKLLVPQVNDIVISANRHLNEYRQYEWPVIPDSFSEFLGPLAGIYSALPYCRHEWIMVFPCDMPLLPKGLPSLFVQAIKDYPNIDLFFINDGERDQNLLLCFKKNLVESLWSQLKLKKYSVSTWIKNQRSQRLVINDASTFKNINYLDDLYTDNL